MGFLNYKNRVIPVSVCNEYKMNLMKIKGTETLRKI